MIIELIIAGLRAVQEYVALHVFTCLIPAFLLAGAMVAFISKKAIMQQLGAAATKLTSFSTVTGPAFSEAPFIHTLMGLGIGKGPELALLLTGPGLSLPNWLAIGRVFGAKKAVVCVSTIIVLGTVCGWLAGTFVL